MKLFGYQVQRAITNKIESPQVEKTGRFTMNMQTPVIRARTIQDYRDAVTQAESAFNPLRYRLIELYQESIDFVPHLRALIELRQLNIASKELKYEKKSGSEDEKMEEWLRSPLFKRFTADILNTKFWGFSLFDFNKDMKDGWFDYDLIPRTHVDPIRQLVYQYQTGGKGQPYNDPAYAKYTMAVGDRRDLGLLKNATPTAIHLRNMTGDMMHYVELAGNNFIVTKTKSNDLNIKNQLRDAMKNIGSGGTIDLPAGVTDLDINNMSSTSQNELFTSIHDLLNKELSKLLVGSTMGIEDGSSLSQAEVHERTMGKVFRSDEEYILDVLNYQFADYMGLWGKKVNGKFKFENDNSDEETKEIEKDLQLQKLGLNFTPEYLAEKYDIPAEAIKQAEPAPAMTEPKPEPTTTEDDTTEDK